ncbi:MAG: iron ABC transporter permease [Oligoflexia bacterium]|nr:iron ABC transporter permease [Oligoflexia bacterium]
MPNRSTARAVVLGFVAWAVVFALALQMGAIPDADLQIVTQIRLPRALLASFVGMGLAVSGAALQALFTNPLCEPYTLGVSSGAALGAVIGTTLRLDWIVSGIAGTAFVGALLFAGILYLVSLHSGRGNMILLLAGVLLGFVGSSLVALWMAFSDASGVQGAMFWLMGDLSRARLSGGVFTAGAVLSLTLLIWRRSHELDALLMGEEDAMALGIPVRTARKKLIFLTSLLVGVCVSAAGMIGFIGLVVPHFVRRFAGALHMTLLPLAALWGAVVLTAADAIGRTVGGAQELPVGVITALVGAPVFLWIMLRKREIA